MGTESRAVEHLLVITTCPDAQCADALADHLVREHLAACVNQLPGVRSTYEWQGKVETAQEVLLLIKSRADVYEQLERAIKSRHPYQVPEVIALPVTRGSQDYLNWINRLVERNA